MTTAQTQAEAQRLDQAMQQADRAEEMAIKYGVGTSLGLEAYASAQTIRALHARVVELEAQAQPAREPLSKPEVDAIGDKIGKPSATWHYEFATAIQEAHGITKEAP